MSSYVYLNGKQINFNNYAIDSPLPYKKSVDLAGLDENKWYPCQVAIDKVIDESDFAEWLEEIIVFTPWGQSNSVSYGNNNNEVFATMTVKATVSSWGIRSSGNGYIIDDYANFVKDNKRIIACKLSGNNNGIIFYLRGGAKYNICTGFNRKVTLYQNGFNNNGENFAILDAEPTNDTSLIDLKSKLGGKTLL